MLWASVLAFSWTAIQHILYTIRRFYRRVVYSTLRLLHFCLATIQFNLDITSLLSTIESLSVMLGAIISGSHSTQFFHNYRPRVDDSFVSELTSAADQVEQRRRVRQDESDQLSLSFLTASIPCCIVGQNESLQVNTDQASLIFFVHSRKACLIFLRCARQD